MSASAVEACVQQQGFWLKVKKGWGENLAEILTRGFDEPDVEFVCQLEDGHDLVKISGPADTIKKIKDLLKGFTVH